MKYKIRVYKIAEFSDVELNIEESKDTNEDNNEMFCDIQSLAVKKAVESDKWDKFETDGFQIEVLNIEV